MKRVLIALLFAGSVFGYEIISFEVNHIPPEKPEEGKPLQLWIEVMPLDKVKNVYLYYRRIGEENFVRQKMILKKERFYGTIPGDYISEPGFEYYIEVINIYEGRHNVFASPRRPQKVLIGEVEEFEYLPALEEEIAVFEAEEIVFAAAKKEQKAREAPVTVSVVTSDDIRRLPAISITEIIRNLPGMEVFNLYPSFTVVGIRGFSDEFNNLIVVLVDGREVNVEMIGSPLWEFLPVAPEDIERIEVIRGPAGSLYGPNAFSGVINIVTKDPEKYKGFHIDTKIGYAPFTSGGSISYAGATEKSQYRFSVLHRSSYFFESTIGNDLLNEGLFAKFRRKIGENASIFSDLSFTYGKGSYFTPFSVFREDPIMTWHFRFGGGTDFLKAEAYWNRTSFYIQPKEKVFYDAFHETTMDNDTADITLQGTWNYPAGTLIGGLNYRLNSYRCEHFLFGSALEHRIGVFLQNDTEVLKWLRITFGVRYDYNDKVQPGIAYSISPRGSFVFLLSEKHVIRLTGGRAYRKPSFLEYQMRFSGVSNVDISDSLLMEYNEVFNSGEIGYSGRILKNLKFDISAYYSRFENAIGFNYRDKQFHNFQFDSNSIGGELSIESIIAKRLTIFANYSFQYITALDDNEDMDVEKGDILKEYPMHKANAGFILRPLDWFLFSLSGNFISKRHFRVFRDPARSIDSTEPTKSYDIPALFILNMRLSLLLSKERFELGIIGYNLLNQQERQYPGGSATSATNQSYIFGGEKQPLRIMGYISGYF